MSTTEEKHVDPVAATAAVPAAAAAAAEPAAPAPDAAPAAITSEVFIAKLLVSDVTEKSTVLDARWVQQNCLRTPSLVTALTAPARFKLYLSMLIGDAGEWKSFPDKEAIESHALKATDMEKEVAAQLGKHLSAHCSVTEAQWQGFVHALSVETGFYYDPEHVDVMLVMARVVAKGGEFDKSPSGDVKLLEHLFNMLDVVNIQFLVSTKSRLYERASSALLHLLLQYHDPELSVHLDRAQVDSGSNVLSWVRRLGVLDGESDAVLPLWDWLFIVSDPTFVPYVILAYLIARRQEALAVSESSAVQAWLETIAFAIPTNKSEALDPKLVDGRAVAPLPVINGKLLMQNAELLVRNTPSSARRVLEFTLCPDGAAINKSPEALAAYYAGAVVLPLERADVAESFAVPLPAQSPGSSGAPPPKRAPQTIQYIVADCRSLDSYEYAHLPTSVFLGDAVSYDTTLLSAATTRLESSKGAHVTLFGTGRPIQDEKNLLNVVALHLVQSKFPYVSYTLGGFRTVVPLIRSQAIQVVMSEADRTRVERSATAGGAQTLAANAAASLTQAFSGISHLWEGEAAQHRAVEAKAAANDFANKAKVGLTSAGVWGASMWQRAQEKLTEAREQMAAPAASTPAPNTSSKTPASTGAANAWATPAAKVGSKKPETKPAAQANAVFTLDEAQGEEEDDFGLITSVPARPMEGAAKASKDAQRAQAGAGAAPKPTPAAAAAADEKASKPAAEATKLSANINAEFDELFGDDK